MENNIVYKVVEKNTKGEFISVITPHESYATKYTLGKSVTAPIGCLFVFKTFEKARGFSSLGYIGKIKGCAYANHAILKCSTPCKPKVVSLVSKRYSDAKEIEKFWTKLEEGAIKIRNAGKPTADAYMVKNLTPIEVVEQC